MENNRRFIEESFPVKEVSIESAKEKSFRHGYISTLHIWWARKPLASSRATNFAALIPASTTIDEWNKTRQFILDLSKWENSLNPHILQVAREEILKANNGKPPKVLDCFSGGGTIPLEALRLGCETYASDYNPVAITILKCTLEYPQKYGKPEHSKDNEWFGTEQAHNPLLEEVKKWGDWVLNEVKSEIGKFYPVEPDGNLPVCYIWARVINCQNPSCGAEIPLLGQFWLAKGKVNISLFPYVVGREIKFKIVGSGHEPIPPDFDPNSGTVSRAIVICPVCHGVVDSETTRRLFHQGKSSQRMVAVVTGKQGAIGKNYRISTDLDLSAFVASKDYLKSKLVKLGVEWGIDPLPDERIPTPSHDVDRPPMYGMATWGELFNSRQQLELVTFTEKVRDAYTTMVDGGYDSQFAKAITSYLALGVDRLADFGSTLCVLNPTGGRGVVHTFGRQALTMVWGYAEANPFLEEAAGWVTACEKNEKWIQHASFNTGGSIQVAQSSATSLQYPDNYFDAVFTDPPYYDNVGYANLSDFFYVWLKRTIGHLYPDLFSTPASPKSNEIVSDHNRHVDLTEAKEFFESKLKASFKEIHRVLRPNGIATIIYAHKSTSGWETLINSLLDSGLVVTGAWPLDTEMTGRLNANQTASLASSIYIISRKMTRQPTGFYNDVQEELKHHLNKRLERLWEEGVSGADFFIAAIGSAIEVFGKYEKVMDYEGNIVRADRLLNDVRHIATDYAVHQILHNGFAGEISDLSRFYVLYRWNYGEAKVEFDEARKLAQSCNIDLAKEWSRDSFIRKDKEFIRVIGPQDRNIEDLKNSNELVYTLHAALLLWEKGKRDDIVKLLHKSGYGTSEAFYRVAQAVSETLPIESKEKKLLDGFLAGKERLREEVRKEATQGRLI